jgi:hypothetical protein
MRTVWQQFMRRNGLNLTLVGGLAIFAAGCGKKETAAPVAGPGASPETATVATASNRPAFSAPAPAINKNSSVLQQLNRAVLGFRMKNGRNPTSVEELATFAGIQVPPPPSGKKYVFNARGLVVMVDN